MNPNRFTFHGVASQMVDVYAAILGPRFYPRALASPNATGRRLQFLTAAARAEIQRDLMTTDQAIEFFESLLECTAIDILTRDERGVFDPLVADDPALLARANDRRSSLQVKNDRRSSLQVTDEDEAIADWYFQLMVRAWLKRKGFGQLRDLRDDPQFKDIRVCEYAVSGSTGKYDLVECKRLHPHPERHLEQAQLNIVRDKIWTKATEEAGPQLRSAAQRLGDLGKVVNCKHLILDISAYQAIPRETDRDCAQAVLGLSEDDIQCVFHGLKGLADHGIDKITVCWENLIYFDGRPRAIVQRVWNPPVNFDQPACFDYEGWTVEGFPLLGSTYREFRVSHVARSLDWIKYGYLESLCPESTFTLGPEETCEEHPKGLNEHQDRK